MNLPQSETKNHVHLFTPNPIQLNHQTTPPTSRNESSTAFWVQFRHHDELRNEEVNRFVGPNLATAVKERNDTTFWVRMRHNHSPLLLACSCILF